MEDQCSPYRVSQRSICRVNGKEIPVSFGFISVNNNPPGHDQTAVVLDVKGDALTVPVRDLRPALATQHGHS